MTMDANELRALAEALLPMAAAPCFDGIDIERAADYLRAQADAQPVAWMYEHDGCVDTPLVTVNRWTKCEEPWNESPLFLHPAPAVPAGWKPVPVEPTPEMLSAVGMMDGYDWHAPGCSPDADHANWYSAMIAAAPAAPPAEPDDPHMIVAEDRFPDVPAERWKPCPQCDGDFDRECPICDGLGRVLATDGEQAEPKPTPASGDDLGVYKEMADSYRNDEPTGAPYGIIDPDYGRVYTIARKLAWEEGYAIGLHGSFTRDLDLIAVPWTDTACEPEHLIRRIVDATGLKLRDGVAVKPHGRRAWTLLFPAFGDPRFVDLSVMPRIGGSDEH